MTRLSFAIGIDLGTTNTVVAAVRDGVAATLADPQGFLLIPSVVSFHPSGSVLVGRAAVERRMANVATTIHSVKRLIGRAWGSAEVEQARSKLPFELCQGPNGGVAVAVRGETYALPEISAFVLRYAITVAEGAIGAPVQRAVVTVPANFNDLQRGATKMAAELAGIEVLRVINEPTAAALAYGVGEKPRERIAVYDLGGGTFDMTILEVEGNVFEVLATAGDSHLGGDDIDVVIADRMANSLAGRKLDARQSQQIYARLRILAEKVKRDLSANEQAEVADDLMAGEGAASAPWSFQMTRRQLEHASLAIVERTFHVCKEALDTARLSQTDIDRVLLVGGATRMPMVSRKVEQFFGKVPIARINPDEVVALGAAVQASLLGDAAPSQERTAAPPRPPSTAAMVSPAGAIRPPAPLAPMRGKLTTSPGLGASVAVPMAAGARPVLIDVTPLSLGVETVGDVCDVVIAANTPVPCDRTRSFTTAADKQTTVHVRVAQGPSKLFSENTCLGELELSGIEPALRGDRTIAVTFEIDANGILNVRARDQKSGREAVAHMKLVGAQTDPKQVAAMRGRQAAHPLAGKQAGAPPR